MSRQEVISMVNQLSESQLMDLAEYIVKLKQADEEGFSEGEKRSLQPEEDPILEVIGTIDAEPFADDIDEKCYERKSH